MTTRTISYKNHRFPPSIIAHAVWLYFRFPLSLRLVKDELLERGIVISYETIRRWGRKFGPAYTKQRGCKQPSRQDIWHLDELAISIAGRKHWLWRAVDQDGHVHLDLLSAPKSLRHSTSQTRRSRHSHPSHPRNGALESRHWRHYLNSASSQKAQRSFDNVTSPFKIFFCQGRRDRNVHGDSPSSL